MSSTESLNVSARESNVGMEKDKGKPGKEERMNYIEENYDVAIVGAGHAGCEAALACARLGLETIVFTVSVDSIALMPCNPNIGGTSKGHLVRELDALGGEMGRNIDKTFIQSRMLNESKGPAVHSLRAQARREDSLRCFLSHQGRSPGDRRVSERALYLRGSQRIHRSERAEGGKSPD